MSRRPRRSRTAASRRLAIEQLETRDLLALTIQLNDLSVVEGQSLGGSVVRSGVSLTQPLTVFLGSTDSQAVEFAAPAVIIPANASSALFSLTAADDGVVDANAVVTITATAAGQPQATKELTIINAEALPLRIGGVEDTVTATPTDVADRFEVTGASPSYIAPSVIDLSQDTPADQRTALTISLEDLGLDKKYVFATSLVKIDPNGAYSLSADARVTNLVTDELPLGFESYDVDMRLIEAVHVTRYATAIDTTLARTLRPGDKVVYVANASGWSNDAWEGADSRALAWYGYRDSTGHLYADFTYTRNVATGGEEGLWAAGDVRYDAAVGAYGIRLQEPWAGPNLAAGTAVRNAQGGSAKNLLPAQRTAFDPATYAASFAAGFGGGLWQSGLPEESRFRPGTVFIKPALHGAAAWNGWMIAPASDAALGPLDYTLPVAQLDATSRVPLVFDVLAKQVFGPTAEVVIASVGTPQHGTATIVPGPVGHEVLQYVSPAAFVGSDEIVYTLRNTADNSTFAGRIQVTIAGDEALREQRLREVSWGFLSYESSRRQFPVVATASDFDASGNPLLSWRVHILPHLGYNDLYNQFHLDEPWNSANNLPLAQQMPTVFRDPDAPATATTTRFRIISGEGSEYYWRRSSNLLVGPREAEFGDGLSNSLLVVETGASAAITWTQPDLPNFNPAQPLAALGTLSGDAIYAALGDGSTIALPTTIAPETFASLVTIAGGEVLDSGTLKRQYAELQGTAALSQLYDAGNSANLREAALAMFNYESANRVFPLKNTAAYFDAGGRPLLSWRVHLLPYLDQYNLYSQFHLDEPWDSPHNLPLAAQMPDVYRSFGDSASSIVTRLKTFTGPDAPFEYRPAGQVQVGPTLSLISDGTAQTILIAEAGPDAAVVWTKPEDTPLDVANPLANLGTLPDGKLNIVTFEGRAYALPAEKPEVIAAMATRRGREVVDPEREDVSGVRGFAAETNDQLNRQKQLAIGALDYENSTNYFPADRFAADGTPLLSWRVLLLPYIGYGVLYSQFRLNEPWDSPHNLALLPLMPSTFRSASDPIDTTLTHMMQFTGPGAPFPATGDNTTKGPRGNQIIDGWSNTFMFVEAGRDVAVPWTKPGGLLYHEANPYSQLGQIDSELLPAFFDGSVRKQPATLSISELSALITHRGGAGADTPPAAPYIRQTFSDARLAEAGADWFDVVFDAPPASPQTVLLSVSNPAVALLDKQQLSFNATNWNVPQRVVIRGVDNFAVNAAQTVTISVGSQSFLATVVDDDSPPTSADFSADDLVAGGDFLLWQRNNGTTSAVGDADHDGAVDGDDLAEWRRQYGADLRPIPEADFNLDGATGGGDFLLWQRNKGTTASAGDADQNGIVDGADLAAWLLRFGAIGAGSEVAAAESEAPSAAAVDIVFEQAQLEGLQQLSSPISSQKGLETVVAAPQGAAAIIEPSQPARRHSVRDEQAVPRRGRESDDSGLRTSRGDDPTPSGRSTAIGLDRFVADDTLAGWMNRWRGRR